MGNFCIWPYTKWRKGLKLHVTASQIVLNLDKMWALQCRKKMVLIFMSCFKIYGWISAIIYGVLSFSIVECNHWCNCSINTEHSIKLWVHLNCTLDWLDVMKILWKLQAVSRYCSVTTTSGCVNRITKSRCFADWLVKSLHHFPYWISKCALPGVDGVLYHDGGILHEGDRHEGEFKTLKTCNHL